jgi:hypothetical protein
VLRKLGTSDRRAAIDLLEQAEQEELQASAQA